MRRWYEDPHAPASGTFLCKAAEVAAGEVREFRFGTDTHLPFRMFLYNDSGTLRAYVNSCPHFDVPLNYKPGDVFTSDRRQFLCMTHNARFNLDDGLCTAGPCEGEGLEPIPLRIDGTRVLIGGNEA